MSQVFRLDRRAVGKISLLTAVFYFSAYFYRFFTLGYCCGAHSLSRRARFVSHLKIC